MTVGEIGGWLFLVLLAAAAFYAIREGYLNWMAGRH